MSAFACPALYHLVGQGPAPAPVEVDLDFLEEIPYQAPPTDALLATVAGVFRSGWPQALARSLMLHSELEDAEQTTFLRAWMARDRFDPRFPLGAWVGRIARNVLLDMARARGRRRTTSLFDRDGVRVFDPPAPSAGPVEEVLARESQERLREALAGAPELVRDILSLREQGLTFQEAARTLGKSTAAIVSVYHRFKVGTLERLQGGA